MKANTCFCCLVFCGALALSGQVYGDQVPPVHAKPYSTAQLIKILRQAGYVEIKRDSDDQIQFKRKGQLFYLNRYDDGDLVLYFGMTGFENLTVTDVNMWNRQKRLTRAYIDGDGDAVLESDILFDGGLTARKIAVSVNVFVDLVDGFEDFLRERNIANHGAEAPTRRTPPAEAAGVAEL